MKYTLTGLVVVAVLSTTPVAAAEDHVILIMSDGYFPQITYMSPGDRVEFLNVSASNQTIISENGGWTLGPIAPNASETMVIDDTVQKTFYNADVTSEDGTYTVEGSMSFSSAPLN